MGLIYPMKIKTTAKLRFLIITMMNSETSGRVKEATAAAAHLSSLYPLLWLLRLALSCCRSRAGCSSVGRETWAAQT